jgi:predicted transport protein
MEIKVQRSVILVRLPETGVVDPEGKMRKILDMHGWGRLKDEIRISSAFDVRYALPFIEAACRTELRKFE